MKLQFRCWNGETMISPDYVDRNGLAWWKENSIPTNSKDVMLWTGLLDKNSKEIYEGDVVDFTIVTRTHIAEIKWMPLAAQFGMSKIEGEYWDMADRQDFIEIIGNIHENPELLE